MIEPVSLWILLLKGKYDKLRIELQRILHENNLDLQDTFCLPFDYRDRFESLAGAFKGFIESSNVGEKLKIDEQLAAEILRLSSALCYLLNSTSLRRGKYEDFDKNEINRKLGRKED